MSYDGRREAGYGPPVLKAASSYETIDSGSIEFSSSTEEDIEIVLGTTSREVLRGRLYIDEDPGAAFSAIATYGFYSKEAMHGADATWRCYDKLVYTEFEVASTGSDANITPDDHTDFSPWDLAYILDDGNEEFVRLATIANTMVAEDTVAAHAIDDGISRVSEFGGFRLYNTEGGSSVWLRIGFASAQTVSLRMELLLKY